MRSPAHRRPMRALATSGPPVARTGPVAVLAAVLLLGAPAVLPSARAEEAPPPDSVAAPPSETEALVPTPSVTPSPPAARGEAPDGEPEKGADNAAQERAEEDLRSIFDPTVIRRRLGIENEIVDLENTAWMNKTKLNGTFAIGPYDDFDLGLSLLVPVAYYSSEEPPGHDDAFGLGDVEVACGAILKHASWFGHAAALQATFNTATDDVLGGNAIVLKPYYVASVRPFSFLGSVIEVDYSDSAYEESGVGKTQNLEVNPSVNLTFPEEWLWFFRVQYKGKVDFENDDDYTNRMEVSLGKIVGDAKEVSMFVAIEFPLDDKTDQYSGKVGVTYFFD